MKPRLIILWQLIAVQDIEIIMDQPLRSIDNRRALRWADFPDPQLVSGPVLLVDLL